MSAIAAILAGLATFAIYLTVRTRAAPATTSRRGSVEANRLILSDSFAI